MQRLRATVRGLYTSLFSVAIAYYIYLDYVCGVREEIRGTLRIMKLDIRWAIVMGTCLALAFACLPPVKRWLLKPSRLTKAKGLRGYLPCLGYAIASALGVWFFQDIYLGGAAHAHRDFWTAFALEWSIIACLVGSLASLFYPLLKKLASLTDP